MISYSNNAPPPGSAPSNLVAPEKGEQEFDDVISDFAQYGRIQFWDDRYMRDQEPFEWYIWISFIFKTLINLHLIGTMIMLISSIQLKTTYLSTKKS